MDSYLRLLQEDLKIVLRGIVVETVEEITGVVEVVVGTTNVIEIEEEVVVDEKGNIVVLLQGTMIIILLLDERTRGDILPGERRMRGDIRPGGRRMIREVLRRGGRRRMRRGRDLLVGELMRTEKRGQTRRREGELIE